jgi:hypothetical protein
MPHRPGDYHPRRNHDAIAVAIASRFALAERASQHPTNLRRT